MLIQESEENYKTGFIKLYRSLKNKGWYCKSEYLHLWIHILLKATHSKYEIFINGESQTLNSGQFLTGRKKLSEETGINESKVERILTFFEKIEHQIEQQKSNKNRIISVVSWNIYQSNEQQTKQQVNNKRTTSEQQVNTNKNEKNEKNEKNINISFNAFWNLYNKKVGDKNKCEKKWNILTEKERQKIIDILPEWKEQFSDKQYQPHPTTFLNQKRWDDEIIKRKQTYSIKDL